MLEQKLYVAGLGIDLTDNGEGVSVPDRLKHVEMNYVTNSQCDAIYQAISISVTSNMLCAEGPSSFQYAGTCNGDSGGMSHEK